MATETSARPCRIRLDALALACALFGLPAPSFGGMLDTALPTFSDATPAQVVAYVPAVVKNNAVETVVICTNLDSAPVHIGLEVFDKVGALVNSVNAGNGALLNVAVGATVSIGTGATALLTEDYKITGLPTLQNGTGRVVASAPNVSCNALLSDELHEILDPNSTLAPPSLVRTPVLSCGDGECSAEVGEDLASCPADCTTAPPSCGDGLIVPPEECDDSDTLGGDGCSSTCTIETGYACAGEPSTCTPVCGDGLLRGSELLGCDDGGTASGDGCSATCTVEAGFECSGEPSTCTPRCGNGTCDPGEDCPSCAEDCGPCGTRQNGDERKCVDALNKGLFKVVKAQNKENYGCIKNGAFGKLTGTIEACIIADVKQKVQKQKDKNTDKAALRCFDPPPFAATDAATGNQLGRDEPLALVHAVFGPNLDSAIIGVGTDKGAARCQIDVTKNLNRCVDSTLKEFNRCKKAGLKGKSVPPGATNPFGFASDVGLCLGFDPSSRIAKTCDGKIQSSIERRCSADLDKFPGCNGPPAPTTATELKECLASMATCRACRAINQTDALGMDCDLFDDGAVNASCP